MKLPKIKSENIVVQHLPNELLVYNLTTNQAFCLNETLAKVFNACDGNTTFADLRNKYKFTDDLIYFALDELRVVHLLMDAATADYFPGMSRREVIRKVGLASMIMLPAISTLVAPYAADAASGGNGQTAVGGICTGPSRGDTSCVTTRCKTGTRTCCIDENDRDTFTCTNAGTDCCLNNSSCVSGKCCRTANVQTCGGSGEAPQLRCSGRCSFRNISGISAYYCEA